MKLKDIQSMHYQELQGELATRLPGFAPKTLDERKKQARELTLDDLLVYAEYVRRNMRYGQSEQEATTYEDAMKLILLPELLRRLELAEQLSPGELR
jgi:hypothetical protein